MSISMMQRLLFFAFSERCDAECNQYFRDKCFSGRRYITTLEVAAYTKKIEPIELASSCVYACCCHLTLQHYIRNNSTMFVLFIDKLLYIADCVNEFIYML